MHDIFKLFLSRTNGGERAVNLVPRLFSALPPVHEVGEVFGPRRKRFSSLLASDGWPITDQENALERWKGHFEEHSLPRFCWKNNARALHRHLESCLLSTIFSHKIITDIIVINHHSRSLLVNILQLILNFQQLWRHFRQNSEWLDGGLEKRSYWTLITCSSLPQSARKLQYFARLIAWVSIFTDTLCLHLCMTILNIS